MGIRGEPADGKPVVARESEPVELAGNDSPLDGVGDDGGTVRAQIDVGLDEVDAAGAGLGQQAGQPECAQEDHPAESAETASDQAVAWKPGAAELVDGQRLDAWVEADYKARRGECQSQ